MTYNKNNKKYNFLLILIITFICIVILTGLTIKLILQRSTLQWVLIQGVKRPYIDLCGGSQLYRPYPSDPSSPPTWPFPAFSLNDQYYVDISNKSGLNKKWIRMYRTDTQKEIGRYYSVYSSLIVLCWANDSSGVYVMDYEPSTGFMDIGGSPSKTGPVKKLLVPQ